MPLEHIASGKVREIYEIDSDHLLFVATDRVSAYDVIMTEPIPDKGRVLTQLSTYFFDLLDTPNHLSTLSLEEIDVDLDPRWLAGRSMVVRRAEMLPIECVVRGYLYGSSWREYAAGGGPSTEHLPDGLVQGSKLDQPMFTPATKAESGHDENLTETETRSLVGNDLYERLREQSIAIYQRAAGHVESRGLIIADTKLEFGIIDGRVTLCDEVLTPDSSRYWPADQYEPGSVMPSYDKQYLRDWLDSTGWDHTPPPPRLPDEIVANVRSRYIEAYEIITGRAFDVPPSQARPEGSDNEP
ncbi:MAG: phosphoribosylaminoimidazolesuccinocarboxamide synthase, partial [Acidimicrobiia bacterium]|nr:phosphoribosylaminoimidazolesuccinocarboxamide synthase [Acidimicrobiia bacterium]